MKKKRPAIEETEKEYIKILDLQPTPPPNWVIAAGSRVGQMWGKFVAEFRAAPIPKEWKGHGPVPGAGDLNSDDARQLVAGANLLHLRATVNGAEQVEEVHVRGWDYKQKEAIEGSAKAGAGARSAAAGVWA